MSVIASTLQISIHLSGTSSSARVAPAAERRGNLPGLFYSYLGLAMARCEGRKKDGLQLCRYAVKVEPMEPDNHVNIAYLYLLSGRRLLAWRSFEVAQKLHPEHARTGELHEELGTRRPLVIRFLKRSNPLNIILGLVVSWAVDKKATWDEARSI